MNAILTSLLALICTTVGVGADEPAATQPAVGRMPHIEIDARARQVRVACEALRVDVPLEFFVCAAGTNEHESVLRSRVRASDLHTALLIIGLEAGSPVHYSEAAKKWIAPHGPPLRLSVEFEKDGKTQRHPAYKLMRNIETKEPMPAMTWIFAGSRVMPDGNYAADVTGYLVSIVNFDLTVIDVPALVSNANETLEWETNLDLMPAEGQPVTLIIEPAGEKVEPDDLGAAAPIDVQLIRVEPTGAITLDNEPLELDELTERLRTIGKERPLKVRIAATRDVPAERVTRVLQRVAAADAEQVETVVFDADPAAERLDQLRQRWQEAVRPHGEALRAAAQTQYDVIAELRREQQRLIDEADRIQRLIDELQREYDEMTTPRPAPTSSQP